VAFDPSELTGHARIGYEYALDVVAGRILASKWTILACQRQLNDLDRWAEDGPYRFDQDRANDHCRFIELLPHVKGEWANRNENLTLLPWMAFIHTTVFGWVHRDTGYRRFRAVYEEMARKNAKSTRLSATALYMLAADGEAGPECYSAATTRDQAKIVFQIGKQMVRKSPGMRKALGLSFWAHSVTNDGEDGTFQALSADAHTLDGLNPSFSAIDELHAHKTRGVYDVLESATPARTQPLLWTITTAGFDRASICWEVRTYVTKVLQGLVADETYFGIIYTIDDEDDWQDEDVWVKANPNLGVSVNLGNLQRLAKKAAETPASRANFLTKHLCVWVSADQAFIDMDRWAKCGRKGLDANEFVSLDCYVGIDLASRNDIAAMVLLFVEKAEVESKLKPVYYTFGRYWLPEETVESSANAQYRGWADSGVITVTPGNTIDFGYIEDELIDICSKFNVREVAFDPWQAAQFSQRMLARGIPMVEIPPTVRNFSEPMKDLGALVLEQEITHGFDPCLTWQMSCVVAHVNPRGDIYPRKESPQQKIDGVVALIMALARATLNVLKPSVYEGRGIRGLES
jgi:phage terminase large subunit-like protein